MLMKKVWFISNFVFGNQISGGVVHYIEMAKACKNAGYDVRFLGGSGMKRFLANHNIDIPVEATDSHETEITEPTKLRDQLAVFRDNYKRCRTAFSKLDLIQPEDVAYAVTDYWCDSLPAIHSSASLKLMILGMLAPSVKELLSRGRPDVAASPLGSLHYHLSQRISLQSFRRCGVKRLFYVHPEMQPLLLKMGYREKDLAFISNGVNTALANQIPHQEKKYDLAWTGRVHRQKGIDDLILTLKHLSAQIPDFKAVIIGSAKRELSPLIQRAGLESFVTFAGFVPEAEKLRLLKSSRLFLMPSHYESWGIVIAESFACDTPVLAYDLPPYRPIFGDLPNYVPCFDMEKFATTAETLINTQRQLLVPDSRFLNFSSANSWDAAGQIFVQVIQEHH